MVSGRDTFGRAKLDGYNFDGDKFDGDKLDRDKSHADKFHTQLVNFKDSSLFMESLSDSTHEKGKEVGQVEGKRQEPRTQMQEKRMSNSLGTMLVYFANNPHSQVGLYQARVQRGSIIRSNRHFTPNPRCGQTHLPRGLGLPRISDQRYTSHSSQTSPRKFRLRKPKARCTSQIFDLLLHQCIQYILVPNSSKTPTKFFRFQSRLIQQWMFPHHIHMYISNVCMYSIYIYISCVCIYIYIL